MFENISEEILNSFSIRWKIADLERRLGLKRTPKKYHEPLRAEINRLERLYTERRESEQRGRL